MDAQEVGDYDLRGPDFDTALVGSVTERIIDADRLVRLDWKDNSFPNWELYRTALAGDSLYLTRLRQWAVAFSVAYCTTGGIKRHAYSDELACVAAWDALHVTLYRRPLDCYTTLAERLGVHHRTYRRLRDSLARRMLASLDEYWIRLSAAYRHVILYERKCGIRI